MSEADKKKTLSLSGKIMAGLVLVSTLTPFRSKDISPLLPVLLAIMISSPAAANDALPQIHIIASVDEMVDLFRRANYWGETDPAQILEAPPYLTVATVREWRSEAAEMPVQQKKELFYRALLPLLLYANRSFEKERSKLEGIVDRRRRGKSLTDEDFNWLNLLAKRFGVKVPDNMDSNELPQSDPLAPVLDELLVRVDTIPPSLSLGQGAYESGYGTSRFALEGNSFFGQWTYGGRGMTPKEKRQEKGNYGVAAYEWPLDSVRSYLMNLNTHNAYAELRTKRKALRDQGLPVTGKDLVGTLIRYSERGQAYVDTLSGIMRVNKLDVADNARLSDAPIQLIVNAKNTQDARELKLEIDRLRETGELKELLTGMGLMP